MKRNKSRRKSHLSLVQSPTETANLQLPEDVYPHRRNPSLVNNRWAIVNVNTNTNFKGSIDDIKNDPYFNEPGFLPCERLYRSYVSCHRCVCMREAFHIGYCVCKSCGGLF